eukprot:gene4758-biopygen4343
MLTTMLQESLGHVSLKPSGLVAPDMLLRVCVGRAPWVTAVSCIDYTYCRWCTLSMPAQTGLRQAVPGRPADRWVPVGATGLGPVWHSEEQTSSTADASNPRQEARSAVQLNTSLAACCCPSAAHLAVAAYRSRAGAPSARRRAPLVAAQPPCPSLRCRPLRCRPLCALAAAPCVPGDVTTYAAIGHAMRFALRRLCTGCWAGRAPARHVPPATCHLPVALPRAHWHLTGFPGRTLVSRQAPQRSGAWLQFPHQKAACCAVPSYWNAANAPQGQSCVLHLDLFLGTCGGK